MPGPLLLTRRLVKPSQSHKAKLGARSLAGPEDAPFAQHALGWLSYSLVLTHCLKGHLRKFGG